MTPAECPPGETRMRPLHRRAPKYAGDGSAVPRRWQVPAGIRRVAVGTVIMPILRSGGSAHSGGAQTGPRVSPLPACRCPANSPSCDLTHAERRWSGAGHWTQTRKVIQGQALCRSRRPTIPARDPNETWEPLRRMANVVAGDPPTAPVCRFSDHPCASAGNGGAPEMTPTGLLAGGCSSTVDTPILRIAEEIDCSPSSWGRPRGSPVPAAPPTGTCSTATRLSAASSAVPTGSGMRSG